MAKYKYPKTTITKGKNKGKKLTPAQYRDKFYKDNKQMIIDKIRESAGADVSEKQIKKYFNQMFLDAKESTPKKTVEKALRTRTFKSQEEFYQETVIKEMRKNKLISRVKDPVTGKFVKSIEDIRYKGTVMIDNIKYSKYKVYNKAGGYFVYVEQLNQSPKDGATKTQPKVFASLENYE